jgi:FkbM family methyltransferase
LPVLHGPLRGTWFILGSFAGPGGGGSVYFHMVEPEQAEAIASVLRPGDVFIDIGANVGFYTILASKRVGEKGRVYAIEPFLRNLFLLSIHVKINRCSNVVIVPAACADVSGIALFQPGRNPAEGRILSSADNVDAALKMAPVPAISLDNLCKNLSVCPSVLKIDVEGAELRVLQGARETLRRCKPYLFISVHSDQMRRDVLSFLDEMEYRAEPIGRDKVEDANEFYASGIA